MQEPLLKHQNTSSKKHKEKIFLFDNSYCTAVFWTLVDYAKG